VASVVTGADAAAGIRITVTSAIEKVVRHRIEHRQATLRAGSQAPQHAAAVCLRAARHVRVEGDRVVLVRYAGMQVQLDGHACLAERERVTQAFVAEDVELADLDVRRRQAACVCQVPWRGRRIDVALFMSRAQLSVPARGVAGGPVFSSAACRTAATSPSTMKANSRSVSRYQVAAGWS
jgi:hypothetical protein